MAINTRSSALSFMKEATEGTITPPAANTDFVAIQDDLAFAPEIDSLENAEAKASLGASKPIAGAENPTVSTSHYIRGSGTAGEAPNYGVLLESAFGAKATRVQDVTTGVSTVSQLTVADESIYTVGEAILIQDATNGYSVRPVRSVEAGKINLGFDLAVAPASGTVIGKTTVYTPQNSGHPTLTAWNYIGDEDGIQMVRGCRVTEWGFESTAGELLNGSFSLEGLEFYANPITITSSTKYLDFTSDNGTFAIAVEEKTFKTPNELADAIAVAMNAADTAETFSCVYSKSNGKFTIATSTSTLLSLLWNTGTNAANTIAAKIGFDNAADDTGATSYESDNAQTYTVGFTPTFDDADPLASKNHQIMFGDGEDYICFNPSTVSFTMTMEKKTLDNICAASGRSGSLFIGRSCTFSMTAALEKYDADHFDRLLQNKDSRFMYIGGEKSGGNWVPGKTWATNLPFCVLTAATIGDDESVAIKELEGSSFVPNDGSGEVFQSYV